MELLLAIDLNSCELVFAKWLALLSTALQFDCGSGTGGIYWQSHTLSSQTTFQTILRLASVLAGDAYGGSQAQVSSEAQQIQQAAKVGSFSKRYAFLGQVDSPYCKRMVAIGSVPFNVY